MTAEQAITRPHRGSILDEELDGDVDVDVENWFPHPTHSSIADPSAVYLSHSEWVLYAGA